MAQRCGPGLVLVDAGGDAPVCLTPEEMMAGGFPMVGVYAPPTPGYGRYEQPPTTPAGSVSAGTSGGLQIPQSALLVGGVLLALYFFSRR